MVPFQEKNRITVALDCATGVDICERSHQILHLFGLDLQLPNEPRSGYAHCP